MFVRKTREQTSYKISAAAKKKRERDWKGEEENTPFFFYSGTQEFRSVSTEGQQAVTFHRSGSMEEDGKCVCAGVFRE